MAAEEAAAALAAVETEAGRTTDPVRMYMREMGTVELLTREGEIAIAKRIEEGIDQVIIALAVFPGSGRLMLETYERSKGNASVRSARSVSRPQPTKCGPEEAAPGRRPTMTSIGDDERRRGEEEKGPDPIEAKRRFEHRETP